MTNPLDKYRGLCGDKTHCHDPEPWGHLCDGLWHGCNGLGPLPEQEIAAVLEAAQVLSDADYRGNLRSKNMPALDAALAAINSKGGA